MLVHAVQCKECKTLIFSRAENDARFCTCGKLGVTGGHLRTKILGEAHLAIKHKVEVENVDEKVLVDDWITRQNKYGLIEEKKKPV